MNICLDPSTIKFLPSQKKAFCCGRLVTNKKINTSVYDRVRDGLGHGTFPHKNFYAYCWFEDGQWHAEVWRKGLHVATCSDSALTQIVNDLTNMYGQL